MQVMLSTSIVFYGNMKVHLYLAEWAKQSKKEKNILGFEESNGT